MSDLLDFDFGFTAVDENELDAVQASVKTASSSATDLALAEAKLGKLYNAILPLLSNLKKNPEKEYILWPNRVEKIEQFEERLDAITGLRTTLVSRLSNLTRMVGGELNLNTDAFSDVQEGLNNGTSRIRSVKSAVADRVLALSRFN